MAPVPAISTAYTSETAGTGPRSQAVGSLTT